ncbi:hypothetical protein Sinac_2311 [Singulisphaera acidiphila DSM 18658]|uniref:Uncharacterized protein n=1 Tax=Singulisphaera acidiphila (strain ATCC BAA-1392 / DSM 18658 / VKM B-2454 / MOB10) TaxID=886293 RepID=L0DCM4_SINAD|nr:hypothetical protein Sinac_2311 [Singulisphaera acidiphila DSM 18658]
MTQVDLEVARRVQAPLGDAFILSLAASARMENVQAILKPDWVIDYMHAVIVPQDETIRQGRFLKIRGRCRFGGVGQANLAIYVLCGWRISWSVTR